MRPARLSSFWRASISSSISPRHAILVVPRFRLAGPVLQKSNQRPTSTKAGTQPSKNRWIANDDETPTIIWSEPISWSQPMKGPGCARGETSNTADEVQKQLHDDGHRVWGFVVYRCTYDDDAGWQTFLERIHASIRRKMEHYYGLDLLEEDCFNFTVLEGASRFDGASVQLVREHFKEWRKNAAIEEQGTSEEIEARRVKPEPNYSPWRKVQDVDAEPREKLIPDIRNPGSNHGYGHWYAAVRYRFCVQIDEAALQSIVSPEGEEVRGEAWVNLIEADWDPEEAAAEEARIEHLEDGGELEDFEESVEFFPELDGCVARKVGWMKAQYKALIPGFYSYLQDPNMLEIIYHRPPEMAGKY